ncbi:MAG TPA: hypothetical protein VJ548_14595, partial [Azospira sp.]|nr:hypothetical protein [Azospira sp.]
MRRILWVACLVLAWGPGGVWADLDAGQQALGRSDYATALKELQPLAERGNSEAQFTLGRMYSYGWGVKKDELEAARWYREAASRGHAKARRLLINLCELGVGAEQSRPDAEKWKRLEPVAIVREGRSLCFKAAEPLEAVLVKQPDDLVSRYRLLGYYYFNGADEIGVAKTVEARRRHILWLIQNHPDLEVVAYPEASLALADSVLADPQGYAEGSRLWLEQVGKPGAKEAVFYHGATYHQLGDKAKAEQILLQGRQAFPALAPAFDGQLGYVYAMAVLGVSRLNHTGLPVAASPEERTGPFAVRARKALETSNSPELVGTAGKILGQYGTIMMAFGLSQDGEMKLAERLLTRADQLQPGNPYWADALGDQLLLKAKRGGAAEAGLRKRALGYLEKSLAATSDPDWRRGRLREVAKLAFQVGDYPRAEKYAKELLGQAQAHPGDEKFGAAVHDANVVLGRLDLKRKAVAEAKEHLLAAGRSVGGDTLSSFGPNMSLAKDLLDYGEKPAVI